MSSGEVDDLLAELDGVLEPSPKGNKSGSVRIVRICDGTFDPMVVGVKIEGLKRHRRWV